MRKLCLLTLFAGLVLSSLKSLSANAPEERWPIFKPDSVVDRSSTSRASSNCFTLKGTKRIAYVLVDSLRDEQGQPTADFVNFGATNERNVTNPSYPEDLSFPVGSPYPTMREAVLQSPTKSYPFSRLIEQGVPHYFADMTRGNLKLELIQIKNPKHKYGAWLSEAHIPKNLLQGYDHVAYIMREAGRVGGHTGFGTIDRPAPVSYTYVAVGNTSWINDLFHELGHAILGFDDRDWSWSWKSNIRGIRVDFNGNKKLEQNEYVGSFANRTMFYDMMWHNGCFSSKNALFGAKPFHTFDLIINGYLPSEEILTVPQVISSSSENSALYRIKAVRSPLNATEKGAGVRSCLKIPFHTDRSYYGLAENLGKKLENQWFLVEYRDGSGYDVAYHELQSTQPNKGVLISHITENAEDSYNSDIDIEVAEPLPPGAREAQKFSNEYFYNGEQTNDWMDDYGRYTPRAANGKGYDLGGGKNWWYQTAGLDTLSNPETCRPFTNNSRQQDFFLVGGKMTPSSRPSSNSRLAQDTHLGIVVENISGQYADIRVYRNHWTKVPASAATITKNGTIENLTVTTKFSISSNIFVKVIKNSSLTVAPGATLYVGQGTTLYIDGAMEVGKGAKIILGGNAKIVVAGSLKAVGEFKNEILIGTTGSVANSPARSEGLVTLPGASLELQYCLINEAKNGLSVVDPSYCFLASNRVVGEARGISISDANRASRVLVAGNTIERAPTATAGTGLFISNCRSSGNGALEVANNTIRYWQNGCSIYESQIGDFYGNKIKENKGLGLFISGSSSQVNLGTSSYGREVRNEIENNLGSPLVLDSKAQVSLYYGYNSFLRATSSTAPLVQLTGVSAYNAKNKLNINQNYFGYSGLEKPANAALAATLFKPVAAIDFSSLLTRHPSTLGPLSVEVAEDSVEQKGDSVVFLSDPLQQEKELIKTLLAEGRFPEVKARLAHLSSQDPRFVKATTVTLNFLQNPSKMEVNEYLDQLELVLQGGSVESPSAVISEGLKPALFELAQNHPNPFNPSTLISFSLPEEAAVKLEIFNAAGQQVKTLLNEVKKAGRYSCRFDGSALHSGVYFYKLATPKEVQVRKMLLLK